MASALVLVFAALLAVALAGAAGWVEHSPSTSRTFALAADGMETEGLDDNLDFQHPLGLAEERDQAAASSSQHLVRREAGKGPMPRTEAGGGGQATIATSLYIDNASATHLAAVIPEAHHYGGGNGGYTTWQSLHAATSGRACVKLRKSRCRNTGAAMFRFEKGYRTPVPETCVDCVKQCQALNHEVELWYVSFKGPCAYLDETGVRAHGGSCGPGCICHCHLMDHCGDTMKDEDWNLLTWCHDDICSTCVGVGHR